MVLTTNRCPAGGCQIKTLSLQNVKSRVSKGCKVRSKAGAWSVNCKDSDRPMIDRGSMPREDFCRPQRYDNERRKGLACPPGRQARIFPVHDVSSTTKRAGMLPAETAPHRCWVPSCCYGSRRQRPRWSELTEVFGDRCYWRTRSRPRTARAERQLARRGARRERTIPRIPQRARRAPGARRAPPDEPPKRRLPGAPAAVEERSDFLQEKQQKFRSGGRRRSRSARRAARTARSDRHLVAMQGSHGVHVE